jgi:ferredoxin-nitrate reductase
LHMGEQRIPASDSLAYDRILEQVEKGTIKALWIVATNTAHSWIDQRTFSRAANQLEFLVVQDMYPTTETARQAHLVLPAAGWGEKEGTFINSERRIGLVKKVAKAPGQALSDFNIFRMIAQYWGCGSMFDEWRTPEAAFKILRRLSANRPCDITGISGYEMLDACGGIQWPFPESRKPEGGSQKETTGADQDHSSFHVQTSAFSERRLFTEGKFFTEDGRARFTFDAPRPVAEIPDGEFPFVLLTGRGTSAQWHTNTRTGKSAVLRALYPQRPYVELNPADAQRLGVLPNQPVRILSRRGSVECTAFVTPTVQAGHIFIPMHYRVTNQLTRAEFDPHSRQPSYKHCAVRLERIPR